VVPMDWGTAILNVSLIMGALEAGGVFKGLKAGVADLANGTNDCCRQVQVTVDRRTGGCDHGRQGSGPLP
jgi:hypothetical protein